MVHINELKDTSSVGIIILNNEEKVLYINSFAKKILNLDSYVTDKKFSELIPLLYEKNRLKTEIELCEKYFILQKHSWDKYSLILIMDTTNSKNTEQENRIFREILDRISDGVRITDKNDIIVYYNKTLENIEGFNREQCIGKNFSVIYPYTNNIHKDILEKGKPLIDHRLQYNNVDGKNINFTSSTFPFFEKDKCLATYSIIQNTNKAKKSVDENINTYSSVNIDENMRKNGTCYTFNSIIGNNTEFKKCINFAHKIARNNSSVLILGETGTGKELFAQSIHNASNFADGPFIALNCAAIPDTLLESVLFGTVQGAFTGSKTNEGLLNQAQNGTIFLDEINSMNLDSQAKLLRFLQDKTIRSVGSNRQRKISCRVISAVNKDIEEEIKSNKLREDLYYRLATVTLYIPPLTQRIDDVPLLAKFFVNKYREQFGTDIRELDDDLIELFTKYSWPGNVRELEHVIESALNMVNLDETTLKRKHLSTYLLQRLLKTNAFNNKEESEERYCSEKPLHDILDEVERQVIIERLRKHEGNITQTAKDLGIFRQALQYRIKKYQIDEIEYH